MGNKIDFQTSIEDCGMEVLLLSGLPRSAISTEYVEFEHRGTPVRIFTVRISTGGSKPTLVMVHGYAASGVLMYPIFKALSDHYNLVIIDQLGWGASTRIEQLPPDVVSNSDADAYALEWL